MNTFVWLLVLAGAPGAFGTWVAMLRRVRPESTWHRVFAAQVAVAEDYASVEAWRTVLVPDGAPTGPAAETALIPGKGVR
ncbi:MAG: hypothetical protein GXX79_11565 [Actinomycetales bacterium]|nr:hypothetical protein [Actinomycetales bacterium]